MFKCISFCNDISEEFLIINSHPIFLNLLKFINLKQDIIDSLYLSDGFFILYEEDKIISFSLFKEKNGIFNSIYIHLKHLENLFDKIIIFLKNKKYNMYYITFDGNNDLNKFIKDKKLNFSSSSVCYFDNSYSKKYYLKL
uniref:Uncharacterized protein n=1 Tax=viral metagenome TaxID=1070528 RepID=A0A6C0ADE1_9ZZZZ